jgi:hypothetical protein
MVRKLANETSGRKWRKWPWPTSVAISVFACGSFLYVNKEY